MMPKSYVRLSAGRENMNEQMQAMCFMAGANSIFYGCKLLTTSNPEESTDVNLFKKLGINTERTRQHSDEAQEASILDAVSLNSEDNLFYDAAK
jgi:biotin synthase